VQSINETPVLGPTTFLKINFFCFCRFNEGVTYYGKWEDVSRPK
jgi:hypothetical protein